MRGAPDWVRLVQVVVTPAGELQVPEFARVEERYKIGERKAISVGTIDMAYTFTMVPKVILLYFEGAGCWYDFNKDATDADSPKVPANAFLSLGVMDVSKMVFKGEASLTVYVLTLV